MSIVMMAKGMDVYEINGNKIGKSKPKRVKGKVVGYQVESHDGSRFFVTTEDVEKLRDSIVVLPDWVRRTKGVIEKMRKYEEIYPEIKSREDIEKVKDLYSLHKEVLNTVRILEEREKSYRTTRDEVLMEISKYMGMRMINKINFIEFSKKMDELERKYKILDLNFERCHAYIELLKSSPFYYEEIEIGEIEEIKKEVEKLLGRGIKYE